MQAPFDYSIRKNTQSYLLICDGGNVRSYSIATMLKLKYGREAIAVGRLFTKPETMKMLCGWADNIVITQPHMIESIPEEYHSKIKIADIGQDRWGININPELEGIAVEVIEQLLQGEGNG